MFFMIGWGKKRGGVEFAVEEAIKKFFAFCWFLFSLWFGFGNAQTKEGVPAVFPVRPLVPSRSKKFWEAL